VGYYGQVTIWDLASVQPVKVLTNVLGAVNDLRFSPDGKILAAAGGQPSAKGDLRLFQVSDWKLLGVLPGHDDVVACVAFRPDGKQLASACFDRKVRLWDLTTLKLERTLTGHSDFVYSVAYAPDGSWLASTGKDRSVKVVETATGKSRLTFSGMDLDVLAVAVGTDGQVVSSGYEAGLYWWNSKTGERTRLQGGHSVAVHELAFSRDGKVLLSAGADGTLRTWDGSTGAPLKTMSVGSLAYACAIHPEGKLAASGSFDGQVRLWDPAAGRLLATLLALPSRDNKLGWLALTPEGYLAGTPELLASGTWQVGNNKVESDKILKVVVQPANVAKAVKGETLTPPMLNQK
jgi:WD40 repeat protein